MPISRSNLAKLQFVVSCWRGRFFGAVYEVVFRCSKARFMAQIQRSACFTENRQMRTRSALCYHKSLFKTTIGKAFLCDFHQVLSAGVQERERERGSLTCFIKPNVVLACLATKT